MVEGDAPILATAIHEGHDLRAEVAAGIGIDDDARRREEDPWTGRWATIADNHIVVRPSRFEFDLNRPPELAVYRSADDCWGLPVWPTPPADDVVERSMAGYGAYYELLGRRLDELLTRAPAVVVLDLHSYNHRRGGPGAPPADPDANPVVNVGTGNLVRARWAPVIDRFIADLGGQTLAGTPLDVRENVRFRGGYQSKWIAARYPTTVCVLAVEVKKVYMDEWTGEADPVLVDEVDRALRSTLPGLLATSVQAVA